MYAWKMLWVRPLALAAAILILGMAVYVAMPFVAMLLFGASGVAAIWAISLMFAPLLRPRDPYDLDELRKVHEKEEVRTLIAEEVPVGDVDKVLCACCMEEYDQRLRSCPRCRSCR